MEGCELVLFDLDDTLYDFGEFLRAGLRQAFKLHPLTCDLEHAPLLDIFEHYSETLYLHVEQGAWDFAEYRKRRAIATFEKVGASWTDDLVEEFNHSWYELALASMKPDESLISLLQVLSKDYHLGVVSNGLGGSYRKIRNLGLDNVFGPDHVFIGEELGTSKPQPESYLLPLRRFGISPANAVFVGDSWKLDVVGPTTVGMQAVWFNPRGRPAPMEPEPLAVISRLDELPNVIPPPCV